MRIEVVNTGNELLFGKILNSHVAYFGQRLFQLGLRIGRQTAIPDGDDIRLVLQEAFPRCDLLLVTGGLGPTSDDITREVVAEMLGRALRLDPLVHETIREMFRRRGLKQNSSNDRQAMVPEGAQVLANPHGTAPGLYLPADPDAGLPHLFLLPGPPRELIPMYETLVEPLIAGLLDADHAPLEWRNFKIFGVGESSLASTLEPDFDKIADLEVGYCARPGEVDLRLIGTSAAVEEATALVRAGFPREIVTESEDGIERVLLGLLQERGEIVSTAESCTGGFIASTLTDVAGSSAMFQRGYVTYSNEAKTEILGVPPVVLEAHGAVSNETVSAMAAGCLAASGADHAIAVSGIAGPGGGSEDKPVGTVHIAIASKKGGVFAKAYFFPVERITFKLRVTRQALDLLRRRLLGFPLD